MTVRELIVELQKVNQDLPVAIADWNEEYSYPSESAAEIVGEYECNYYPNKMPPGSFTSFKKGLVVVIGGGKTI